MATIVYQTGVPSLPEWAHNLLSLYIDRAGVTAPVVISSTYRSPQDQARAMYNNIVQGNKVDYAAATGGKVVAVGEAGVKKGDSRDKVIADMVLKIEEIGPGRISKHMDPDITVCDIRPSQISVTDAKKIVAQMKKEKKSGNVGEFLYPESLGAPEGERDPAIHVEILNVPFPEDKNTSSSTIGREPGSAGDSPPISSAALSNTDNVLEADRLSSEDKLQTLVNATSSYTTKETKRLQNEHSFLSSVLRGRNVSLISSQSPSQAALASLKDYLLGKK